jgi:hypothetical protein
MEKELDISKLSLNDKKECTICKDILNFNNKNICSNCTAKIKFLYEGWDIRCIYCNFFVDYNTANICNNCKFK